MILKIPRGSLITVGCITLQFIAKPFTAMAVDLKKIVPRQFENPRIFQESRTIPGILQTWLNMQHYLV